MSDDENKKLPITKQVEQINAQLRDYGRVAVQEIKMMKDGKVIGQVRYGYKPQYVFDAVMSVISITDGVSFTIFGGRSSYRDYSSIVPLPIIAGALPQTPRF